MKIHTFGSMKREGIGIVDMRHMAAQDWQSFQNDMASEEGTKPVRVTAKTAKGYDFAAFAILQDGEPVEVIYAVVENDGDFSVELAHEIFPDW